jgi:DNA-binding SARP family transcriptional activator
MSKLTLALLGTPRLSLGEESLDDVFYEKVEALLAYLAVENNRPHRREVLAELFWPDLSDDHARSNLRYALYKLREALRDKHNDVPFLMVNRTSIRFNPASDHYLDVAHLTEAFEQSLRPDVKLGIQELEQLCNLYRGDFLEQSTLTQNELFYEWLCNKREIFHRYELILLGRLIELLAHSGKSTKAIEAYNNLSHLLNMELGIRPNEESTELIRNLLHSKTSNYQLS